jgi:CRP/FNR family cyclic AMP-dependent transcriptional regulator
MQNSAQIADWLSEFPTFHSLGSEQLLRLSTLCQHRIASRDQYIYTPGDAANHVFFLVNGKIKTGRFFRNGREVVKDLLYQGDIFGDHWHQEAGYREEFAQALHDGVSYLEIASDDFRSALEADPCLLFACVQRLSMRLRQMEDRLASMMTKDARQRIISFLHDVAARDGRRVGVETLVQHHLTQADIASLTGTSRQTVTAVLNELRTRNVIYIKRNSILIRDMDKLAV